MSKKYVAPWMALLAGLYSNFALASGALPPVPEPKGHGPTCAPGATFNHLNWLETVRQALLQETHPSTRAMLDYIRAQSGLSFIVCSEKPRRDFGKDIPVIMGSARYGPYLNRPYNGMYFNPRVNDYARQHCGKDFPVLFWQGLSVHEMAHIEQELRYEKVGIDKRGFIGEDKIIQVFVEELHARLRMAEWLYHERFVKGNEVAQILADNDIVTRQPFAGVPVEDIVKDFFDLSKNGDLLKAYTYLKEPIDSRFEYPEYVFPPLPDNIFQILAPDHPVLSRIDSWKTLISYEKVSEIREALMEDVRKDGEFRIVSNVPRLLRDSYGQCAP